MASVLTDRMWERLDITRGESETAVFYDLMFFGELMAKLTVLGLLSAVEPTRERHQYRLLYKLARANGIGDWAEVLQDLLDGPASGHQLPESESDRRDLTQKFAQSDASWQYEAVAALQRACTLIDPSRQGSRGKTALRVWFNDFAWLRNRTRGHGAPRTTTCQQLVPEIELSIRSITENMGLLQRDWAYLRRNLSGKYRVTKLAGDCVLFDRLKSDDSVMVDDGVYIAMGSELRRVQLIETDADLTDIYVANGGFKHGSQGAEYELLSYYTEATKLADATPYLLPPTELPPSETRRKPALELVGGSFTNAPAQNQDYVSRPELEKELLTIIRDKRHPMVTLVGRGGIGKTSLAVNALVGLAGAGDFFAIIWFSARDIDLLEQGAKLVSPDVLTKDDIASSFADLMVPDWRRRDGFDRLACLARSLSGEEFPEEPLLFVFDNFETVRDPAELYAFLDNCVRLPNKVLITSRFRDFRGDYPIPIQGMAREEFEILINSTAGRLGILDQLTPKYRDSLFTESDGHPYVGKMLLGEAARTGQTGSVERVMAAREDVLNALFERTFRSISAAAQRAFLTLCSWRSPVPRLALEAALLRPANERMDVGAALEVLLQSSMIEMVGTGEAEGEFVRVPLAAYVFGQKKLRVDPAKIAIEADAELLKMFGAAQKSEIGRGIGPRVRGMVRAIAAKRARDSGVQDELEVVEYVAGRYPRAYVILADYYLEQGDRPGAVQCLLAYLEAHPVDRDIWLRLADLYLADEDGPGEVFARVEAARLSQAPLSDISNAASTLNRHKYRDSVGLAPDEARSMAQELITLILKHEAECDATDFSRLAWLYLNLNNEPAAKLAVERGLQRDAANRHCVSLAQRLGV